MDYLKQMISKQDAVHLVRFWAFFFLLSIVRAVWADSGRNSQYSEWLKSYDGEFNQLKYTEVAYRGNRQANAGREQLAPADLGGNAHGLLGNFYAAAGLINVQGLNQNNLLIQTNSGGFLDSDARFKARGQSLELSKRFHRIDDFDVHLGISYLRSSADINQSINAIAPLLLMPSGEQINAFTGTQKNDFFNLDLTLSRHISSNSRYSIEGVGGIRLSDLAIKVRQDGSNSNPTAQNQNLVRTLRDYHFRNTGAGLFLGFSAHTPITRSVHFGLSAKQIFLPSRGTVRLSRLNVNSNAQNFVNETNSSTKSSSIPITELSAELNFFWDHATRLNLGYAYSHWNFYEIQGFARSNFQDVSFSGPRFSLNYHF